MIDITGLLDPHAKASTGKKLSLHKQLVERLRQAILSGRLPSGATLTSSRTLSSQLGISRNTVVLAYEQLAAEGYVIADQHGTKVADLSLHTTSLKPPSMIEESKLAARWENLPDLNYQPMLSAALLSPGVPSLKDFPIASWRRSLERAVKQTHRYSLATKESLGELALRKTIATHLHISRGVQCEAEQIVITEGALQALELCVTLLCNPGETVWIEDPCYSGVRSAFNTEELKITPISVDDEGLAASQNHWTDDCPKLIFTSPAHQYPTGAVLSVPRRLALIDQARKVGAWIIEDDYDGDFRHSGTPISSMQGLVKNSPVIYIGSFSKTMFPTLRIGFMVVPKALTHKVSPVISRILRVNNQLQQNALADFMVSGEFGRHLGRMRRIYRERQRILKASLTQHFPTNSILGGSAGMHLTLTLPTGFDDRRTAKQAQRLGIKVDALSSFYTNPTPEDCGLVIGYGNTSKEEIPYAVGILAEVVMHS